MPRKGSRTQLGEVPLYGPRRHRLRTFNVRKRNRVDNAKIEVTERLPPPTNVKGIRSFQGHAGFYRWFIANFSKIVRPLTNLLAKDVPLQFNDECHKAFDTLKKALISALIIQPPDWKLPFEIMCDASDYAVWAVLGQTKDKKHHMIIYASKTLMGAQLNYATTEKGDPSSCLCYWQV